MKNLIYFYIKYVLQICVPFKQYQGYGIYNELFVFWLENKKCAQTMKFPPEAPLP